MISSQLPLYLLCSQPSGVGTQVEIVYLWEEFPSTPAIDHGTDVVAPISPAPRLDSILGTLPGSNGASVVPAWPEKL